MVQPLSMQTILDLVQPGLDAKWVVFYSLGEGADKGVSYDAHPIEHTSHHLLRDRRRLQPGPRVLRLPTIDLRETP